MEAELSRTRVDHLAGIARGLTHEQVVAIGRAQSAKRPKGAPQPDPEAFWLAGGGKVRLTAEDKSALDELWTRMLQALAMRVGPDQLQGPDRRGRLQRLRGLIERADQGLNDPDAMELLEASYGAEGMSGVVAIWNALCAALLPEKLEPAVIARLELAWREAIGDPPRERLSLRE